MDASASAGFPTTLRYDGAFQFCRIMFRNAPNGDGGGWSVDWPRADENLSVSPVRADSTPVSVSSDTPRAYNHDVAHPLTDARRCPAARSSMLTEPGGAYFDETEAQSLARHTLQQRRFPVGRRLLGRLRLGALGRTSCARRCRPGEFTIADVPLDHPIFHMLYDVRELPQIPSIGFWAGTGGRHLERGRDSAYPHVRARLRRERSRCWCS